MSIFTDLKKRKEIYLAAGIIIVILIVLLIISISHLNKEEENTETVTLDTLLSDDLQMDREDDDLLSLEVNNETRVYDVVVDVKGAVKKPGVFSLTSTQRVIDAIEVAEGLCENADTRSINFARLLEDEMSIYIPVEGEDVVEIGGSLETDNTIDNKININDADEQQLLQLSGIGPSKATEIIKYREANGRFNTIHEITKVSGIGEKTFEKIEAFIEVK